MHGDLAFTPVILLHSLGHCLRSGACGGKIQGHDHLHTAVIIAHHRHKGGGLGNAADHLHFGQMLMGQRKAVAFGGIQLAVGRALGAFVVRDHFFAATRIARNARAAEKSILGHKAKLHNGMHQRDKAGGIAAGHRHAGRGFDLVAVSVQLGQAIGPRRVGAEGSAGVQNFHLRLYQRHHLTAGGIGQAQKGQVAGIDHLGALVHILAALLADAEQLNVRLLGKAVENAQAGGSGAAVNKNLKFAHGAAPPSL